MQILKQYDSLKEEQKDIRRRINRLNRELDELMETVVADTVKGTRPDGTYGPIKIKGAPTPAIEEKKRQLQQRIKRYQEIEYNLQGMIVDVEKFINSIESPQIRMILRHRYIDGWSWRMIGRQHGKGASWAYKKVQQYFIAKK